MENKTKTRVIMLLSISIIFIMFLLFEEEILSIPYYFRIIIYILYGLSVGGVEKLVNK